MKSTAPALALLACSLCTVQAQAARTTDIMRTIPLLGASVCTQDVEDVVVNLSEEAEQFLPRGSELKIQEAIYTKIKAYRMISSEEKCESSTKRTFIVANVVITSPIDSKYRAYTIDLSAKATGMMGFLQYATLWNDSTTVVSSKSAPDMLTTAISTLKDAMDNLAADYALANP